MNNDNKNYWNGVINELTEFINEMTFVEAHDLTLKIDQSQSDNSVNNAVTITGNASSLIHFALETIKVSMSSFNGAHYDMGSTMFTNYDAELCIMLKMNKNTGEK